jgi:hypothetical protein
MNISSVNKQQSNVNGQQSNVNEETLLRIETLRKEYDIVLKQYQEAMKTYINDLSDENVDNQCVKYKLTDANISQLCYDKIWHDQGCLTDTPIVDASKTLDELVINSYKSATSDDKTQCYGSTDASSNIVNPTNPTYPTKSKYITLKGKSWLGTSELKSETLETEDECIAMCEIDPKCSGATFNPTTKYCQTRQGDSSITDSSTEYAIVKKLKYKMLLLKTLNSKLITLNEDITTEIRKIEPTLEPYENEKQLNNTELENYHANLLRHRNEILRQLNDYENIEAEYDNSSVYVKQQHWMYNIFALIAIILGAMTIKKLSEGDNNVGVFILIGFIWALYVFLIKYS